MDPKPTDELPLEDAHENTPGNPETPPELDVPKDDLAEADEVPNSGT